MSAFLRPTSIRRGITVLLLILVGPQAAQAEIIQTNFGTGTNAVPGGPFDPSGNILSTNLLAASATGSFYRDDSGYPVVVSRLYDGNLGPLSSGGLGGDGNFTVMPNVATIQFDLDAPYDIAAIRTYASWDSGRDGQQYTVSYATALDPSTYTTLLSISRFDVTDFPLREDYDGETGLPIMIPDEDFATTLVQLMPTSGFLAQQVVSLRFTFNGVENGGTAYREFQVTAVPEPSTCIMAFAGLACGGFSMRRQNAGPARSSRALMKERWVGQGRIGKRRAMREPGANRRYGDRSAAVRVAHLALLRREAGRMLRPEIEEQPRRRDLHAANRVLGNHPILVLDLYGQFV